MIMKYVIMFMLIISMYCCNNDSIQQNYVTVKPLIINDQLFFPLGYPDMNGYHDANPFGNITSRGFHLGADLNKDGGGDNDLGDTIFSIGHGRIVDSRNPLIVILHRIGENDYILSGYYHCNENFVAEGDTVQPGTPIGTVGKKNTTLAHLHFEILTDTTKRTGFYGKDDYCVDPIKFISNFNSN